MTPEEPGCSPETQRLLNLHREVFSLTAKQGIEGWALLASSLFFAIAHHHDLTTARKIFDRAGSLSKRGRARLDDVYVLQRLAEMQPRPNIAKLAQDLAKENKKLPRERQHGPGGTDPDNLETYIRRLVKANAGRDRKLWDFDLYEKVRRLYG
jgi:hypothetical protein